MNWIKIDNDNLPPQNSWVIVTDGKGWAEALVTYQFEFVPFPDSKFAYSNITHFLIINLPTNGTTNQENI